MNLKNKIQPCNILSDKNNKFTRHFSIIRNYIYMGTINNKTDRLFDLSYADQKIAAYALTYNFGISSTDNDLIEFLKQAFDVENYSPLALLTTWIKAGFVNWNKESQSFIEDWIKSGEPVQSVTDITEFEKLTEYTYPIL